MKTKFQQKQIALQAMQKKFQSSDAKVTDEYYDGILITLSDHVKYRIDDSISVYEFCNRIKRLNNYIKTLHSTNIN